LGGSEKLRMAEKILIVSITLLSVMVGSFLNYYVNICLENRRMIKEKNILLQSAKFEIFEAYHYLNESISLFNRIDIIHKEALQHAYNQFNSITTKDIESFARNLFLNKIEKKLALKFYELKLINSKIHKEWDLYIFKIDTTVFNPDDTENFLEFMNDCLSKIKAIKDEMTF